MAAAKGTRPPAAGIGRKRGVPNKATADIRDAAQQYTPEALQTLVTVMCKGKSEVARLAAANAILDRGHGKPQQSIDATHRIITDPAELTYEQLSEIARGGLGSAHGKPH